MEKQWKEMRGKMEHITLFTDILPEEQERMRVCFHAREMTFRNGETIMEYSNSMKKIGLILYGRAILYCCDTEGNEYMIDELNKDAVFGEPFLLPTDSQHYYVRAAQETRVIFIDYEHVIKRCDQACHITARWSAICCSLPRSSPGSRMSGSTCFPDPVHVRN